MSSKAEEEAGENVCANCGITEVDEIKLQKCQDCDLVKYCSEKCGEEHRQQHIKECKRRANELCFQECKRRNQECKRQLEKLYHHTRLFTQPDCSYLGLLKIIRLKNIHT